MTVDDCDEIDDGGSDKIGCKVIGDGSEANKSLM